MVGWHHRLNGLEFEKAPRVDDGQGSLACCSPWGHKESDMTEWLTELLHPKAWRHSSRWPLPLPCPLLGTTGFSGTGSLAQRHTSSMLDVTNTAGVVVIWNRLKKTKSDIFSDHFSKMLDPPFLTFHPSVFPDWLGTKLYQLMVSASFSETAAHSSQ